MAPFPPTLSCVLLLLIASETAAAAKPERSNACGGKLPPPGQYARCAADPLARAGYRHNNSGLVELSVGDPDVTWSADTGAWQAYWSTGLAASYTSPMTMAIKRAASSDGVHWNVQAEPVLYAGGSDSDWDYSKVETPTVIRLPARIATKERQWLMLYSGGNDKVKKVSNNYTWYQLGAAFSPDGVNGWQRVPAKESPYYNETTPYGCLAGLVLMGRDAFPGFPGVVDGVIADPELAVDDDGQLHVYFTSMPWMLAALRCRTASATRHLLMVFTGRQPRATRWPAL